MCCRGRDSVGISFFFQAEDGIRDLVRSRGLGDVYKRQVVVDLGFRGVDADNPDKLIILRGKFKSLTAQQKGCLLYTSDAADERSSVDLGGRRIIKKKNHHTARKG